MQTPPLRPALFALVALVAVAACGPRHPAPATPSPAPAPADPSQARPQAGQSTPASNPIAVKIVGCCVSGTEIGLWVALDNSLFQKHSLAPTFSLLPPPTGVQALVSGDVHIGTAPGNAITAYATGYKDLVFIAGNVSKPVFRIMAHKSLRSPEDLRGKVLGVSGKYAPPAVAAMNFLERQYGMKADVDYKLATFKQISDVLAALQNGAVVAGVLSTPLHLQAEKLGFQTLIDLRGTFDEANAYILTTRTFAKNNHEAVLRFLQAYVEGIALARRQPEIAIASIQKHTSGISAEDARATYDEYISLLDVNMTAEAFKPYLIYTDVPQARDINPSDVMDFEFLQKLDKEGFLREHGFTLRLP